MSTPREVMQKYILLLNQIQGLGMPGFASFLDTSSPAELDELAKHADGVRDLLHKKGRKAG